MTTLYPGALSTSVQFVPDAWFNQFALNAPSPTNPAVYPTYKLFIAKDNSEAFTLDYVQSGKKRVDSQVYVSMDTAATSQNVSSNLGRGKIATVRFTAGNADVLINSLTVSRSGFGDPKHVLLIAANYPNHWFD